MDGTDITLHMHIHSTHTQKLIKATYVWEYYVCENVSFFQNYHPSSNSLFKITFDSIYVCIWIFSLAPISFPPILTIGHIYIIPFVAIKLRTIPLSIIYQL